MREKICKEEFRYRECQRRAFKIGSIQSRPIGLRQSLPMIFLDTVCEFLPIRQLFSHASLCPALCTLFIQIYYQNHQIKNIYSCKLPLRQLLCIGKVNSDFRHQYLKLINQKQGYIKAQYIIDDLKQYQIDINMRDMKDRKESTRISEGQ
ncbi:hypothetical protein FGO68_gene4769 [Halteria grandinella]|uniref:Uncharacterized protein n=1 Tax=Halteria grandinella TaxID=5974 RepID=A0A8J8NWN4_HALGN|nr:hypothetical protein FGO68_gene4769 [Halteria grandinella]